MLTNKDLKLTGRQKASVLMVALGADLSAAVLQHLDQDEVEIITGEIARMKEVDSDTMRVVVEECQQRVGSASLVEPAGLDFARRLLDQAVGSEMAGEIVGRMGHRPHLRPFDSLRSVDPQQLFQFLQSEHSQTIALVLSHLPAATSAAVLSGLPPDSQADVATRIATMDATTPEVIQQIEQVISERLSTMDSHDVTAVGGATALVEILNQVDRATERTILEGLSDVNPTLADAIKEQMFVFEDVVTLDNRTIQSILREVEQEDLRLALKGVGEAVRAVIFRNISDRASETLKEDLEVMGPVRLRDVEAAQKKIVAVIRRLEESGEVVVRRGGGDDEIID